MANTLNTTPDLESRFQIALQHARRATPGSDDYKKAVEHLEYILTVSDQGEGHALIDRVCFLLGSLLDDFPENTYRAITVYRRGLEADPLFAPGHNNLGVLLMQNGQILSALGEF